MELLNEAANIKLVNYNGLDNGIKVVNYFYKVTLEIINLIFTYSLRYIMIQIFILISPFAFLTLISNSTDWFFKVWLKNFVSLLLVQILIALILLLSFSINYNSNIILSKLLFIGIIFALSKANGYIKEIFGSISTTINTNISKISNFF